MTGWLCREPMKATAKLNFAQGRIARAATNEAGKEQFRKLTQYRSTLIEKLSQFQHTSSTTDEAFNEYISHLIGLMEAIKGEPLPQHVKRDRSKDGNEDTIEGEKKEKMTEEEKAKKVKESVGWEDFDEEASKAPQASKPSGNQQAREAVLFKYHDNIANSVAQSADFEFELASMVMNYGLWHMKHASWLEAFSAPETEREDVGKAIFDSLKIAAGVFSYLLDRHLQALEYKPHTDFDERMLSCRYEQCLAEAQEGVIERARSLGHSPSLIASIAYDEFKRYEKCSDDMSTLRDVAARHLHKYYRFKASFYKAYTQYFQSVTFNTEDDDGNKQAGNAMRCLRDAQSELAKAQGYAREYIAQKSFITARAIPSTPADKHKLFHEIGKKIGKDMKSTETELTLLYHQPVPKQPLPFPEPKSVIEEIDFELPAASDAWKTVTLDFDKIPLKGQDEKLDKRSGDSEKVKANPFDPVKYSGNNDVCSIQ
eukprot:m.13448 g.13448  ORF g.13448 m.13448 type:complete len:484 (-) comp7515_c1_seq1:137-1588(-)